MSSLHDLRTTGNLLQTPTLRSGGLKLSYIKLRQMWLLTLVSQASSQSGAGFFHIYKNEQRIKKTKFQKEFGLKILISRPLPSVHG
jgi:hypothetical protein